MKIEEGIYTLNRDVENPSPDRRRKRETTAEPVWSKGSRWVVEDQHYMNYSKEVSVEELRKKQPFALYRVYSHGDRPGSGVMLDSPQGQALWIAMEKQPETAGEVLERAGFMGPGAAMERTFGTVFSVLIEAGKLKLEDIKWAVEQFKDEGDTDDEEEDLYWERLKRNGFV